MAEATSAGTRLLSPYSAAAEPRSNEITLPWNRATTSTVEDYIDDIFPTLVADLYFTKAWAWGSEIEHRFLLYGKVPEYEFLDVSSSLIGVFLGPRFPYARIPDIRTRCRAIWDAKRVFRVMYQDSVPIVSPISDASLGNGPTWKIPGRPLEPDDLLA